MNCEQILFVRRTTCVPFNILSFCLRDRGVALGSAAAILNDVPRDRHDRRQAVKVEETWFLCHTEDDMPGLQKRETHLTPLSCLSPNTLSSY